MLCVAFSPRGNILASGSYDESVRLWDVRTGKQIRAIGAHSDPITSVCFNSDGSLLATSSYDGLVRVWDVASAQCLKTLQQDGTPPASGAVFTPNDRYLLVSTLDGVHRLWDYGARTIGNGATQGPSRVVRAYSGHTGRAYCVQAGIAVLGAAGRQVVYSGGDDGTVTLWDASSRSILQRIPVNPAANGAGRGAAAMDVDESDGHTANGDSAPAIISDPSSLSPVTAVAAHPTRGLLAVGETQGSFRLQLWENSAADPDRSR